MSVNKTKLHKRIVALLKECQDEARENGTIPVTDTLEMSCYDVAGILGVEIEHIVEVAYEADDLDLGETIYGLDQSVPTVSLYRGAH